MIEKPKFLFAGGGTGGHLFSGIAVAELLRERLPGSRVLFVGTRNGLEKDIVPKAGFDLDFIEATPLKGSGWVARIRSLLRLPRAYRQSKKILKKFQPDIVIGIGGYASGAMVLAAHYAGLPTALIEQNSVPGFTNRQLGRFAGNVFIAFEKAKEFFSPAKTLLTGNPARRLQAPAAAKEAGKFCLFVMGGSQGAHALNVAVMEALPGLKDRADRFRFIHQTGSQDFEAVKAAYAAAGQAAEVFPFTQDLAPHYARADLMLCRAGAGTIGELQNLGLASILVPYPFAADDHQRFNAAEMVASGAAEMILNADLSGAQLGERLRHYSEHPEKLNEMGRKARALAKPEAAAQVLEHCLDMIEGKK
ncbi:MAG TPA: undecaprenyldiphospho-muramoylpentapeptide beta-N-acetylglucosaminyltransferase [bacterium]|nr:undecaprenyldiphospho-muramoylpentapeptide beta-N-acetylglucosaminyltransferase [bacterium]